MIYTVKRILETFKDKDPNEVIHLWYREKSDYEVVPAKGEEDFDEQDRFEIDPAEWKRVADLRCRIEGAIDDVMYDLVHDNSQRADYPEWFFEQGVHLIKVLWSNEVLNGCSKNPVVSKTKE